MPAQHAVGLYMGDRLRRLVTSMFLVQYGSNDWKLCGIVMSAAGEEGYGREAQKEGRPGIQKERRISGGP